MASSHGFLILIWLQLSTKFSRFRYVVARVVVVSVMQSTSLNGFKLHLVSAWDFSSMVRKLQRSMVWLSWRWLCAWVVSVYPKQLTQKVQSPNECCSAVFQESFNHFTQFLIFRVQSLSCQFSSVHYFVRPTLLSNFWILLYKLDSLKKTIYARKWWLVTTTYVIL